MGKLQIEVLKHKWTKKVLAQQTGGVEPVIGSGLGLAWCDAEAIRKELQRMGARKQSFV